MTERKLSQDQAAEMGFFEEFTVWRFVTRGVTRGGKGVQFPWRRITMGVPNHCGRRRMNFWVRRKVQTMSQELFVISYIACERPQVRTWGRQTCFLSRSQSNLVTPAPLFAAKCAPVKFLKPWISSHFPKQRDLIATMVRSHDPNIPRKIGEASPAGNTHGKAKRPIGWLWSRWSDCISDLAWSCFGVESCSGAISSCCKRHVISWLHVAAALRLSEEEKWV